ncbi:MAG: LysR family transcriptional regulator, partial [Actinophytocola sp.]|nr:LysR family transcriptional regulator [Actinophytocola sp.]
MSMNLALRHLRVVVAVHDENGYTAAAKSLHVAQSSVSRTVEEVERRVGVLLFDRTTRRVTPTPPGEQFVAIARKLLADSETAFNHFDGYLRGRHGLVSVATLASVAATMIPTVLSGFRQHRPQVEVAVQDAFSLEVLDRVSQVASHERCKRLGRGFLSWG